MNSYLSVCPSVCLWPVFHWIYFLVFSEYLNNDKNLDIEKSGKVDFPETAQYWVKDSKMDFVFNFHKILSIIFAGSNLKQKIL